MIIAGWGLAQNPTFLPGLTIKEAAAGDETMVVLLLGLAFGALVLVPSLFLLFRLVLTGRFDLRARIDGSDPPVRAVPIATGPRSLAPASASGAAGAGLLLLASASWLQILGALTMLAAIAIALPGLVLRDQPCERG